MSEAEIGDAVKRLMRAVVVEALRDIGCEDGKAFRENREYILRGTFAADVRSSGYPELLIDAAREAVARSRAERKILAQRLIKEIRKHWA